MTYNIEILNKLNDELKFIAWYNSLNLNSYQPNDEIALDMSKVSFVIPFCMLSLLSICKKISEIIKQKVIIKNFQQEVFQYFERMDFFKQADDFITFESLSNINAWERSPLSTNVLEITKINREPEKGWRDIVNAIDTLKNRVEHILGFWLCKRILEINGFVTVLSEICQNIFEHSEADGYVVIQKYNIRNHSVLSISVVDIGIGIKKSLRTKINEKYQNDSDYLIHAFKFGVSRSKGGGLCKVMDYVKKWKGALLAWSGRSVIFTSPLENDYTKKDNLQNFQGTNISIWITE